MTDEYARVVSAAARRADEVEQEMSAATVNEDVCSLGFVSNAFVALSDLNVVELFNDLCIDD